MSLIATLIGWAMKLPPATHSELVCEVDLRVPMPDGTVLLANRTAPRGENHLPNRRGKSQSRHHRITSQMQRGGTDVKAAFTPLLGRHPGRA